MQYFLLILTSCACLALAYPAAEQQQQHQKQREQHQGILPDGRIVGGHQVDISQYAHQVSMRNKNIFAPGTAYSHICGGSIIGEYWILTAAHCIIARVPSQLQIVAGTNNRRGSDGVIVPVAEIIMHENYNPNIYDNDIALLRLGAPMPLNNFTIKAIEMADKEPLDNTICTITGWGTTTQGGVASDKLLAVDAPIVDNEKCNEDYGAGRITESMLCAGVRGVGGKDACQGDSGGPLVIRNKLYGVVSWGYGCAQPDYPGVYANVAKLRPWIDANVKGA